jgi:hypothetical protein
MRSSHGRIGISSSKTITTTGSLSNNNYDDYIEQIVQLSSFMNDRKFTHQKLREYDNNNNNNNNNNGNNNNNRRQNNIEVIENSYLIKLHRHENNVQDFQSQIDRLLARCKTSQLLHIYPLTTNAIAITNTCDDDLRIILDDPNVIYAERVRILISWKIEQIV